MAHLLLLEGQRPAFPLGQQIDPSAGRFGLQACGAESWTCVEAQAAVDARGEVVVAKKIERFVLHTTNLPGFRVPSGSKAFLSRRITPIVSGGVPPAPIFLETSVGPDITPTLPCPFSPPLRPPTPSSDLLSKPHSPI